MRRAMDAFAEHYLATYAAIFLPSWTLEAADDDPLRAPVRHRQDELAAHIERRLAPYADRVVRLPDQATAVDAVVDHVLGGGLTRCRHGDAVRRLPSDRVPARRLDRLFAPVSRLGRWRSSRLNHRKGPRFVP